MMKKQVFIYITFLVVGLIAGYFLNSFGVSNAYVRWKFGASELEINLKEDMIDSETFLTKLFSEEFSKQGTIGWLKLNAGLYAVNDHELTGQIAKLDVDLPISESYRNISQQRLGPWAYQIDSVLIGVPDSTYQPAKGYANVCESGPYRGHKIVIYNLDQTKRIEVQATGQYACPNGLKYPNVQLNAKDAAYLLGYSNFQKYEKAIVVIDDE
jgi:hypothetical protein